MNRNVSVLLLFWLFYSTTSGQSWIRINQLGYLPESVKVAVFISTGDDTPENFTVCDAITDRVVYKGNCIGYSAGEWGLKAAARLAFSKVRGPASEYSNAYITKS